MEKKRDRKQVKVGTPEENQMIALVKKATEYFIDKKFSSKKTCAEAAMENFKENSGIDPSEFTTVDCVAHHVGTLEKLHKTGEKPSTGKARNIQTVILEKVYPKTFGKLPTNNQISVEELCPLEEETAHDELGMMDDLTPKELEMCEVEDSWSDTNPPEVITKEQLEADQEEKPSEPERRVKYKLEVTLWEYLY